MNQRASSPGGSEAREPGVRAGQPAFAARILILALILLPFAILKFSFTPGARNFGLDAGYYYQIARNVAEGEGLVTSVSLYHQALDPLPQTVPMIYPAWPLLLGYTGRLIGLMAAALILPKILYVLNLILVYFVCLAGMRRMEASLVAPGIPVDAGHLVVLLLASNEMFFFATSHPYTEGLGFAFAFSSLILLDEALRRKGISWAVLAGTAAGLSFLTRTQLFAAGAAIALILLWRSITDRRYWRLFTSAVIPLAVIVGGWYFLLKRAPVERADLQGLRMWVDTSSRADWLMERLSGLWVAFDPLSSLSYVKLFGPAAYLPIVALAAWIVARSGRKEPSSIAADTFHASVVCGLLSFGALNLFHQQFFLEWLFGWRHGLPYLFLIIPATIYLLRPQWKRSVRLGIALVMVWSSGVGIARIAEGVAMPQLVQPTKAESEMLAWVEQNHAGVPTLLTTHAQNLAVFSGANFHWMECDDPPERTIEMIEHLPIDYLIVYGSESRCSYQARSRLRDKVELVKPFGDGEVFLLRPVR